MKMKKCLSILLAVVMIATMITSLPITANAIEIEAAGVGEGTLKPVGTAAELEAACNEINMNGGTYTISLTADIEEGQVEVTNSNAVVTVIGNGYTLTATKQSAVYVANGATVNLGNGETELTLSGTSVFIEHEETANDEPGLVYILSGSTCNMDEKVTLKDRTGENYLGGGVTVQGGSFVMNGGTIQNCGINGGSVCYGGGVAVFNSGYFEMNGGTITGCYAKSDFEPQDYDRQYTAMGGGVFVTGGSVFSMNGGTISNCEATNFGGGVAVVGARKFNNFNSKFTLIKGTISDNKALGGAGIFASGFHYAEAAAISMTATIDSAPTTGSSSQSGSAESSTPNAPGLYINGGLITQNTATGTYDATDYLFAKGLGGGILVSYNNSNLFQIHNAIITFNNAEYGAGIASFYSNTNADIDGCEITDNTAQKNGGGVYLTRNNASSKTTIKNTTINGNTSGDRGAGVYYDANSKLYISGANVIQNNKYNEKLNNLNVLSVDYPVYVNGALTGSQIGLSDPTLWDDGKEDAATDAVSADKLTSGYKEHNPEAHPNLYFTSDHETWVVERTAKTTITAPDPDSKAYREYKVKRYAALLPNTERYSGHYNQYIITDIQNPELTSISTNNDIINELKYRFESPNNYTVKDQSVPSYGSTYITYTPIASDSTASSIRLQKAPNKNEVTLTYNGKQPRGSSVVFTASPNIQSSYANSGELVLQITSNGDTYLKNYSFSTDYTDETINYVNANPPGNVLYEYDEYGDVAAKLEIGTYEPKQAQITVETGTDEEVRLVRKTTVDYHINNDVIDNKYDNSDIFTDEIKAAGTTVNVGDMIKEFYTVPEVVSTSDNTCPYIFKGWYYDKDNDTDDNPVVFGTDTYTAGHDIYAHWIKVDNVDKDAKDEYSLPQGYTQYGGFDLAGVQIREGVIDTNYDNVKKPGGMRFITSLSKKVVSEINKLKSGGNNIEYGYVATTDNKVGWINYHEHYERKLQYVSESANGINTLNPKDNENETYFGFAKNVNCTSRQSNSSSEEFVKEDHRSYDGYLLYTLVVTYEGATEADKAKNVLARPYIHYKDANGLERVAYSDYNGKSNKLGGCYISYKDVK